MKYIDWDDEKNAWLKKMRGISFDEIKVAIENGQVIEVIEHQNQKRYKGQQVYIVEINNYIYIVPFVEDEIKKFLKTIYPSRNATKKYLKGK